MQRPFFIHHHLGMGDHIVFNGLIRSLLNDGKVFTDAYVFAKQLNSKRVARMFDDDSRVSVIEIPSDQNEILWVNSVVAQYGICDFLRCGFGFMENMCAINPDLNYDEAMYVMCGVPFQNRWSKFSIRRDFQKEKETLQRMNPTGEDFIFVHDDPARGFTFDPVTTNLKIIRNDPKEDLFDMIGVLKAAKEIHCMESSFRALIDHVDDIGCPLYFYRKIRENTDGTAHVSSVRKKWITV